MKVSIVELAAVELLANCRKEPALRSMYALPAVELLAKNTDPMKLYIVESPAVERLKKFVVGMKMESTDSFIMVALPAVDVSRKLIVPPSLRMDTLLPAVALLENAIVPPLSEASTGIWTCCVIPELFVIPMPLIVRVNPGLAVMV